MTHLARLPVDVDLALAQHAAYIELLRRHGYEIVEAPELDEHPDGLFVEDALVMIGGLALLTRPGAPSRRGEVDSVAAVVAGLGLPVARITEPGTLDGGDVLVTDRHVFVGRSTRTNAAAIDQLIAICAAAAGQRPRRHAPGDANDAGDVPVNDEGAVVCREVVAVAVERSLHLKSAITALPDGSLMAVPGWVDRALFESRGYLVRDAPETTGGDLLDLGGTVVLPNDAPRTAALLADIGFAVEPIDVGELQKIEAGVTCMSVLIHG